MENKEGRRRKQRKWKEKKKGGKRSTQYSTVQYVQFTAVHQSTQYTDRFLCFIYYCTSQISDIFLLLTLAVDIG